MHACECVLCSFLYHIYQIHIKLHTKDTHAHSASLTRESEKEEGDDGHHHEGWLVPVYSCMHAVRNATQEK